MDAINCKKCGAVLPLNARVCPRCGTVAARPSGQEVRQRIQRAQGSTVSRTAVPPPRKASSRSAAQQISHAEPPVPAKEAVILCLTGIGLWALQLLFLFIKTVFLGAGSYGMYYSFFSLARENGTGFLGVILLLVCLLGLVSMALPLFLGAERSFFRLAAVPAGLSLLLSASSLLVAHQIGTYPSMRVGFVAWLFLINCVLLMALTLSVGQQKPSPAPEPAPQEEAPPHSSSPAASRPTAPSVPDAETIASLRRIAMMHKQGLISDEEFARVKAECVARGWIRES